VHTKRSPRQLFPFVQERVRDGFDVADRIMNRQVRLARQSRSMFRTHRLGCKADRATGPAFRSAKKRRLVVGRTGGPDQRGNTYSAGQGGVDFLCDLRG